MIPRALKLSLLACSVPGALVALFATAGAWLQWGGLSFTNPVYYLTLAVAVWCPATKLIAWWVWQRQVENCLMCRPANAINRQLGLAGANCVTRSEVDH